MAGSKRKDTFQPYEKKAGSGPGTEGRSFPPKTHNHADALRTLSASFSESKMFDLESMMRLGACV